MPGQPSLITALSLPSQDASGAGPGESGAQALSAAVQVCGHSGGWAWAIVTAQPHQAFWAPGS